MTRSSRDKLNAIHIYGAIAIAAIVGVASESWMLFLLAFGALIGCSIFSGEIRSSR